MKNDDSSENVVKVLESGHGCSKAAQLYAPEKIIFQRIKCIGYSTFSSLDNIYAANKVIRPLNNCGLVKSTKLFPEMRSKSYETVSVWAGETVCYPFFLRVTVLGRLILQERCRIFAEIKITFH